MFVHKQSSVLGRARRSFPPDSGSPTGCSSRCAARLTPGTGTPTSCSGPSAGPACSCTAECPSAWPGTTDRSYGAKDRRWVFGDKWSSESWQKGPNRDSEPTEQASPPHRTLRDRSSSEPPPRPCSSPPFPPWRAWKCVWHCRSRLRRALRSRTGRRCGRGRGRRA